MFPHIYSSKTQWICFKRTDISK